MTMTRLNDNRCWFSLGPVRVLTAQQFGRSLLTYRTEPVMPPFPEVARTVPEKNPRGEWTATIFLSEGWGCLGAKCVRSVEKINGRCPGGGGVDTALG